MSLSPEDGYIHLEQLGWSAEQLQNGQSVKLKELPFKVRLFKVVATNGDVEWVITNRPGSLTTHFIRDENAVRWQIEQMHRELKQLTGTEKCECRSGRAQRNHLACCYLAWLMIKFKARQLNKTLYAVVKDLWSDHLRAELRHPRISASVVA